MNKKLKILVSCYACSPKRGSEPGMGWSFVLGLSKYYEVHVISEKEKWEKDITEQLSKNKNENLKFYFISKKRAKLLRKIWPPSYYWFYKQWQQKAFALAKELDAKENFDLIHQLNMVGYREPSFLWKIKKPFVWGPIGGTENIPWKLFSLFSFYGKLFYGFRNVINTYQLKFFRRPKLATSRKEVALIAATPDIQKSIQKYWNKDSYILPEIGAVANEDIALHKRNENEPLKIVWTGQHIQRKALHLLLKSLALVDASVKWELHVLGIGSETNNWKKLAKNLNVDTNCIWHGWVEKSKALAVMKEAHVLAITSLYDLTSTVIVEGISLGLPVVTLDHCGFSFVINETCGIKIPVNNPEAIFNDFSKSIKTLYEDENHRFALAEGALQRAKDFSWDNKIVQLNKVYQKLIG
jgi:glycosyltransferase involved in cell wall biosynthesis